MEDTGDDEDEVVDGKLRVGVKGGEEGGGFDACAGENGNGCLWAW